MTTVLGVAVLTAFAAWSPTSVRKLLLFSIAFGLCAGWIVSWTAKEFGLARRWAMALAFSLTMTGLIVIAVRGHQQFQNEQAAATKADPKQAMALNIMEAAAAGDPQLAAELAERRRAGHLRFGDYLALRVKPLGEWQQPWPAAFWGVEVLLAAACGAFLVSRQLHPSTATVEEQI